MGSRHVIETLSDAMVWRGIPEHICSDNGPEFIAQELRRWLGNLRTGTLYIEPGSPWENGYCESFNVRLLLFDPDGPGIDCEIGELSLSFGDFRWSPFVV